MNCLNEHTAVATLIDTVSLQCNFVVKSVFKVGESQAEKQMSANVKIMYIGKVTAVLALELNVFSLFTKKATIWAAMFATLKAMKYPSPPDMTSPSSFVTTG